MLHRFLRQRLPDCPGSYHPEPRKCNAEHYTDQWLCRLLACMLHHPGLRSSQLRRQLLLLEEQDSPPRHQVGVLTQLTAHKEPSLSITALASRERLSPALQRQHPRPSQPPSAPALPSPAQSTTTAYSPPGRRVPARSRSSSRATPISTAATRPTASSRMCQRV
jgi:hypothetical protein